jgi:hypothetical protein
MAVAEAILRAAGGQTKAERETATGKAAQGSAGPRPDDDAPEPDKSTGGPRRGGANFFAAVNLAALDDLGAWVPKLFPKAKLQATGAYRVTSADLGRPYEEDLSIHPDGVQDFGPRKGVSPCDLVMEWGSAPTVQAAAHTLCQWLGRSPSDFGWKAAAEPKARVKPAAAPHDLAGFDLTEDGIALAFTAKHKNALRYCHHTGAWFQWNGSIWRREADRAVWECAGTARC